jgi:hypothetical protein
MSSRLEAAFLTDPRFQDITEGNETQKLRLLDELRVFSAVLNTFIHIPAGFEFEESIPSFLFSLTRPVGESKRAACIHDWLYIHGSYTNPGGTFPVTRLQADAIYHEFLRAKGVSPIRAYLRWLGVRLGGRPHFKSL